MESLKDQIDTKATNEEASNMECSICLGLLTNPITTPCKHSFCKLCLSKFDGIQTQFKCPLCRQLLPSIRDLSIDKNLVQAIMRKFPIEYERGRQDIVRQQQLEAQLAKTQLSITVVYGNTCEELDPNSRNPFAWTCFVTLEDIKGRVQDYIECVEFQLHESFANPIIKHKRPPFEVTKKGWGTFELPIKIYWKSWLNQRKPLVIEHNLQFDLPLKQLKYVFKVPKNSINNLVTNPIRPIFK